MTVFVSPASGFETLSDKPPEGWVTCGITKHRGLQRLYTVFSLDMGDKAYYSVQLETGKVIELRIQGLLGGASKSIFYASGMISVRPGCGYHPYWAQLFFDNRRGGTIAYRPETQVLLDERKY